MGISELIVSIAENGILIVVAAIFLFIMYKQNKIQAENYNKLFDKMLEDNDHNEEKEEKAKKYEKNINQILSDLLYSTDSARTFYIRFHNGGHDLNKMSFLKMSMTNERVRAGILPMSNDFTNQFRSVFVYPLTEIAEKGEFLTANTSDLKEKDNATYLFLYSRGVYRSYLVDIKNANGTVIGIVGVEYMKKDISFPIEEMKEKTLEAKMRVEAAIYVE